MTLRVKSITISLRESKMIKSKITDNKAIFYLSGDLNAENHKELSVTGKTLEVKDIQLINDGIKNWNTDFVVLLYKFFKKVPLNNIEFIDIPEGMKQLLSLALQTPSRLGERSPEKEPFLDRIGGRAIYLFQSFKRGMAFISQCLASWQRQLRGKAVYRSKDFWLTLSECGPKAITIVSLISFMVGLILAFVGALQLKTFGAQVYVASLVTIGMTRIMGAIMTGIIMAGRTGASYAATIGTMQVNEELDALKTMGISRTDFLVLPRINALLLSMPILVLLSDVMGILGGCAVCVLFLQVPLSEYIRYAIQSFDITNFLVGLFHGVVFGWVIALCGCYFGIHCGRNADSVGVATTRAVVYSIVWMIIMTGILTLACEVLGI